MFVTLITTILSRRDRHRAQGTHYNDAASWTSVTRLLVKDKTEERGDAATYTVTIERIYEVSKLTTVSGHSCQCSSNRWVIQSKCGKCT